MTLSAAETVDAIVPYTRWRGELDRLSSLYRAAQPFPHVVLEDFLEARAAESVLAEFPDQAGTPWIHYLHVNEKKLGLNAWSAFGPATRAAFEELNSPRFLQFLGQLTGIEGLFADGSLEGGGLHWTRAGGYLNVHADFTVHPHHRDWERRINLLVYLNRDWDPSFGGDLELWDVGMKRCVERVAPLFNQAVIFNTSAQAYHGHPEPLVCPADRSRVSMALYYFTKGSPDLKVRSTHYRARPGDGAKRVWMAVDMAALRAYDRVKRMLGLDDRLASRLLGSWDRIKRRFSGPGSSSKDSTTPR